MEPFLFLFVQFVIAILIFIASCFIHLFSIPLTLDIEEKQLLNKILKIYNQVKKMQVLLCRPKKNYLDHI